MLGILVLLLVIYLIFDSSLGFPIGGAVTSGAANGYKAGRDERRRQVDAQLAKTKQGKQTLARRQRNRRVRDAAWQALQDGAVSGWGASAERRTRYWDWVLAETRGGGSDFLAWFAAAREQLSKKPSPGGEPGDVPAAPAPQRAAAGPQQDPSQEARGPQQAPAPGPQQPATAGRKPATGAPAPNPATAGSAVAVRPAPASSLPRRPIRSQPVSAPLPNRPDEILAATVRSENVREDRGSMGGGQRVTCREHERYRKDCCNKAALGA